MCTLFHVYGICLRDFLLLALGFILYIKLRILDKEIMRKL